MNARLLSGLLLIIFAIGFLLLYANVPLVKSFILKMFNNVTCAAASFMATLTGSLTSVGASLIATAFTGYRRIFFKVDHVTYGTVRSGKVEPITVFSGVMIRVYPLGGVAYKVYSTLSKLKLDPRPPPLESEEAYLAYRLIRKLPIRKVVALPLAKPCYIMYNTIEENFLTSIIDSVAPGERILIIGPGLLKEYDGRLCLYAYNNGQHVHIIAVPPGLVKVYININFFDNGGNEHKSEICIQFSVSERGEIENISQC